MAWFLVLAFTLLGAGCRSRGQPVEPGAASLVPAGSSAPSAAAPRPAPVPSARPKRIPPEKLPALVADADQIALEMTDFAPAEVSVPRGTTRPRPIVIVLHDHGGRPETECATWRTITGGGVFVLCPRGIAMAAPGRFGFGSPAHTTAELRAALHALKGRFGDYVAPGAVVLIGVGVGAEHVLGVAQQEPAFFSQLALVDGGADGWSSGVASIFRDGGGKRVLFVCGEPKCLQVAQARAGMSKTLRLEARAVSSPGTARATQLQAEVAWLVAGDVRFAR